MTSDAETDAPKEELLREMIVAEIMTLVRPEPRELKPKPTIDELERMLNSTDPLEIDLRSDGSIYARPPHHVTVGNVADAVMRLLKTHAVQGREEALRKALEDMTAFVGGMTFAPAQDDKRATDLVDAAQAALKSSSLPRGRGA